MSEQSQTQNAAAVFDNRNRRAVIGSVEFTPLADGTLSFFYAKNELDKDTLRQWLKTNDEQIIAETAVDKTPVIVTHSKRSPQEILSLLQKTDGNNFTPHRHKGKFNFWAARGTLGTTGQLLQLTSSYLARGGIDAATMGFALSNLTANGINIYFGAQKNDDKHQLAYLKRKFNHDLAKHLPQGETLPDVDEKRKTLYEKSKSRSLGQRFHDVMQANSVWFGEIGLRYLGSLILVFPLANWKKGWAALSRGAAGEAFNIAKNSDLYSRVGGSIYLTGKTIAFLSKVPDPYDPKPNSKWDDFREKYTFRMSSLIEACAGATIAYDRLKNREVTLPNWKSLPVRFRGLHMRDYFGGIGGLLFTGAYLIRFFAPYGIQELDVDEVRTHVTDSLAKVPAEKVPQLLADCAATIKEHVKDRPIQFGQIYTQMLNDLYAHHHIAVKEAPLAQSTATPQEVTEKPKTTVVAGRQENTPSTSASAAMVSASPSR